MKRLLQLALAAILKFLNIPLLCGYLDHEQDRIQMDAQETSEVSGLEMVSEYTVSEQRSESGQDAQKAYEVMGPEMPME